MKKKFRCENYNYFLIQTEEKKREAECLSTEKRKIKFPQASVSVVS